MLATKNWLQAYPSSSESRQLSTLRNYFSQVTLLVGETRYRGLKLMVQPARHSSKPKPAPTFSCFIFFIVCLTRCEDPQTLMLTTSRKILLLFAEGFLCICSSTDFCYFSKVVLVQRREEFHLLIFQWDIIIISSANPLSWRIIEMGTKTKSSQNVMEDLHFPHSFPLSRHGTAKFGKALVGVMQS